MKLKGFSLMELIIVIVIIGLLVGAMIPMFASNTDRARRARAQSECDAIKTAVLMYHTDTGLWPTAFPNNNGHGLILNDAAPVVAAGGGWNGPYIEAWRNDPWGHAYSINIVGTTLHVVSLGADGVAGGAAGSANEDIDLLITPTYP